MAQDYYQLLGVKRSATQEDIRKAYRRQKRLWRSRLNAPDLKLRQEAERMLVDLEAANKVLLNTRKYNSDRPKAKREFVNQKKHKNKQFSLLAKIKLAFKIFTKGLSNAAKHIINLIGKCIYGVVRFILLTIWNIIKFIAIVVGVILFILLFSTGFGALILFILSIYENNLDRAFLALMLNYSTMSIVTFIRYSQDKWKAKRNLWRISEAQLHSLELIGGWVGAFFAQVLLQHKSSKESYQLTYWLIVLFHASLFLFFLPLVSPYDIPQKYIVIVNAVLLIISLDGIRKKGVMN